MRKAKDAIHYYRQVSVPSEAVVYASNLLTKVKINRVEPFSIYFPRCVDFCFTLMYSYCPKIKKENNFLDEMGHLYFLLDEMGLDKMG